MQFIITSAQLPGGQILETIQAAVCLGFLAIPIDGAAQTPTDTGASVRIRTRDGSQWVDKKKKKK